MNRQRVWASLTQLAAETWLTSWELVRITVPVVVLVKLLEEVGGIALLSSLLEPFMGLMGLPGELGLVWATAICTTLYGGLAVFAAIGPGLDLTVAQVTGLASAMLIAHALPIELSISKRAGAPLWPVALIRFCGAIAYAAILDVVCRSLSIWQQPATLIFSAPPGQATLLQWALQQLQNIVLIIGVIFVILLFMRLLRRLGVLTLLENVLAPVLPVFGMSRRAAPLAVVGMVMGLGVGGALIIREAQGEVMSRREIFNSMALMGLCHGLIEDTLVMMAMGGRLGGIFWGRILFSLLVIFLLVRISGILGLFVHDIVTPDKN